MSKTYKDKRKYLEKENENDSRKQFAFSKKHRSSFQEEIYDYADDESKIILKRRKVPRTRKDNE